VVLSPLLGMKIESKAFARGPSIGFVLNYAAGAQAG